LSMLDLGQEITPLHFLRSKIEVFLLKKNYYHSLLRKMVV